MKGKKKEGSFDDGYAIITGKIWRGEFKDKYLVCIDLDNKKGVDEFLTTFFDESISLKELEKQTLVVQHEDTKNEKCHVYYITDIPIKKRVKVYELTKEDVKNNILPSIEVKSDSSTYMAGPKSTHENGYPYEIVGTDKILILDKQMTQKLEKSLDIIHQKYFPKNKHNQNSLTHKSLNKVSKLSEELQNIAKNMNITNNKDIKIHSGSRSNTLISFGRTLLNYNYQSKDIENIKEFFYEVNEKLCNPPMFLKEVEGIWNQAVKYFLTDLNKKHKVYIKTNPSKNNNKFADELGKSIDFENQNNEINENNIIEKQNKIFSKIPDKKIIDNIIKTAEKTVKKEDSLIPLLLYTGLGTYTNDPINLGIIAPTSEGKTYPVSQVIDLFPKQDVWVIGSMSPKVIIRKNGILVDENNNPIKEEIKELRRKINIEKDNEIKEELEEELDSLLKNSKIMIDLTNKVLVFLEPPHKETWDILKPILSHDSLYIEHPYVYRTGNGNQIVNHIITKGWPSCIFCSAKDESNWPEWDQIQSRFFITSPNMIKQKYQESNNLIAKKKGLPKLVQQQTIVSDEEIQLSKDCILLLKNVLLNNKDSNVWIPFESILSESLPSEKGTDVRFVKRLFSLLNIISKVNLFNRLKLQMGNESLTVATPDDLEEVLKLIQNLTGLPTYKLKFFIDVFIPLFVSKDTPDRKSKNDGDLTEEEDRIALTTAELAERYKKINGKPITTDNIQKTYLTELENNGLLDKLNSKIDRRKKIYYPIVDVSQFLDQKISNYTNPDEIDNNLQFARLKLSNNYTKIDENWLKLEILNMLKYGIGKTNIFKLLDEDDNEMCVCQFIGKYNKYGDLESFFQYDDKVIYFSKMFGTIKKF